ncbi:MAG TPA: hypothetical protein VGV14_09010 [Rhodanobacter sp.]|nr:hypothetical protein [Rhodanobacter sp.]
MAVLTPSSAQDQPSLTNAVAALQVQLEAGSATLAYDKDHGGYLKGLLSALKIPPQSQLLPFTRSSFQFDHISPQAPRAIYFGDDVAVGTVQGGKVIEVIVNDRKDGLAFYTLPVGPTVAPRFERRADECGSCHAMVNKWALGWIVANITATPDGMPQFADVQKPFDFTDDRTPFADRWGGWYVTGTSGLMRHRGNVTSSEEHPFDLPLDAGLNITDLSGRIDTNRYLMPGSDIVALMTLEHQTGFISRAGQLAAEFRASAPGMDASVDDLVSYMTFAQALPLPALVKGDDGFDAAFAKQGPRDSRGRSLRDFDLNNRVFRYPLSYMIYSQAFDQLPAPIKARLWRRLYDVLRGADPDPRFVHLNREDALAAIAIVAATKPSLPDFWIPLSDNTQRQ